MAIVSLLLSFIFILYGKFFDFEHNNSRRPPLLQAEGRKKRGNMPEADSPALQFLGRNGLR